MYFEMRDATDPERLPEVETSVFFNDNVEEPVVEIFLDEPINTPDSATDVLSPRLVMSIDEARHFYNELGEALGAAPAGRAFQISVTRTTSGTVTFTENEARRWFPEVRWEDPERSHAGDMDDEITDGIPEELQARLLADLHQSYADDTVRIEEI